RRRFGNPRRVAPRLAGAAHDRICFHRSDEARAPRAAAAVRRDHRRQFGPQGGRSRARDRVGAGKKSMRRERRPRGAITGGKSAMKQLDVRGAKCPIPIVKAKKEIDQMQPGELLEVIATDPGSVPDFKGWAQTSKTAVLKEQRTEKQGATDLYIHVLERK